MCFLFVDHITQIQPGKYISGIKTITPNDRYLLEESDEQVHFASSLIGEALGQLAAWNVMVTNDFKSRPVAGVVGQAELYRSALVGEQVELESFIDYLDDQVVRYHSRAKINQQLIFTVEEALGPLLPMENFITQTEIRAQFAAINQATSPSLSSSQLDRKNLLNYQAEMKFDEVIDFQSQLSITAKKYINPDAPYFADHFPLYPVLPMTILLESKLQLAQLFLKRSQFAVNYQIKKLRKIKMNEFILPQATVITVASVHQQNDQQLTLRYRSEVRGKRVCVVDIIMVAVGEDNE